MDRFDQLAAEARVGYLILGNTSSLDFELIDLHTPSPSWRDEVTRRNLDFIGVTGYVADGSHRVEFVDGLDERSFNILSALAVARYAARFGTALERALARECDWMRFAQGIYGPDKG